MSESRELGIGVITAIVTNLKAFGYPTVTVKEVAEQLRKPSGERDIIEMFAADMLRDNGVYKWTVSDDV